MKIQSEILAEIFPSPVILNLLVDVLSENEFFGKKFHIFAAVPERNSSEQTENGQRLSASQIVQQSVKLGTVSDNLVHLFCN